MWAFVESGSVSEIYTKPKALKIGDNQYPQIMTFLTTWQDLANSENANNYDKLINSKKKGLI